MNTLAGKAITATAAAWLLDSITPAGAVDAARCEFAADFIGDLRRVGARQHETRKRLTTAVQAAGTSLTGLSGAGPVIAAAVIGDVRDVSRFPSRDHFAAYNGTAPIEVSSGQRTACRLSRRGNRRLSHAIHMAAVTQIHHRHSQGRACYDKKPAEGKTPEEALRSLKRRISDAIFTRLRATPGGPQPVPRTREGNRGTALTPARPACTPDTALRAIHSRVLPPHYDRPGHSRAFLDRCHPAAGAAAGPGGAPAAKRGRTTWRRGKTTAILAREEGHGSSITGHATAPEDRFACREKDRRNPLTQRGFRRGSRA